MFGSTFGRMLARMAACALLGASFAANAQIRVLDVAESEPGRVAIAVQTDDYAKLTAHQFVLQVGKAQPIAGKSVTLIPVTPEQAALVLCIDRSGSMRTAGVAAEIAALRQTLAAAPGLTQLPVKVDIIAFSTTAEHLTPGFTDAPAAIDAALANLRMESDPHGRTHLNDAILTGIAELRASPTVYRRLLVISDGDDEGSNVNQSQLIQQLTGVHPITVDAIGFGPLAASESGSLATAAGATGGRFALANDEVSLAQNIVQQIRQFAVGQRYSVAFDFAPAPDGQVETATLLYRAQAQKPQALALRTKVTAPALPVVAKKPDPPLTKWQLTVEFLLKFKLLLIASLTLVFAVTTIVAVKRGYIFVNLFHIHPTPQPLPQPLPPTRVPTPDIVEPQPKPAGRAATLVAYRWPLPSQGQVVAILQGRSGVASGRQWRMERGKIAIGSASNNDLVLEHDDFVSGHHAWIRAEDHGLYLTDLGSTNGTRVNAVVLKGTSRALLPGDRISVGHAVIEIMVAGPESSHSRTSASQRA